MMQDQRLMLACSCGFKTRAAAEMVEHMFATRHGLSERLPPEDEAELRTGLVEALARIQLNPECGERVDADDLEDEEREAVEAAMRKVEGGE